MSILSSIIAALKLPTKRPAEDERKPMSLKESFAALKYLPKFLRLVWQVSPAMMSADILIRVMRAAIPLMMLYTAKLITDEIVHLIQAPGEKEFGMLAVWIGAQFFLTRAE